MNIHGNSFDISKEYLVYILLLYHGRMDRNYSEDIFILRRIWAHLNQKRTILLLDGFTLVNIEYGFKSEVLAIIEEDIERKEWIFI